jgi:hypothetical protein
VFVVDENLAFPFTCCLPAVKPAKNLTRLLIPLYPDLLRPLKL